MKKLLLFVLAATAFAACSTDTTQDLAPEIPTAPDELQVSFDEEDTRIQLGDACRPVWTKGDLVSVFYRSNANSKYQFTGETGDVDGTIKLIEEGVATQQTTQIVAVYPYSEDYWLNWNTYDIEASLPAEQTYLKDSFGVGSSLMVSSNVFTQLSFKNVCGWLKLQFTGTGYVSKIVLKGNNGEQVAGKIYVNTSDASSTLASTMGESGDDIIESRVGGFIEEEGAILTEITLNCGDGVALNPETPTAFYIALPPQTFEKGFTATMYGCDGSTKEISTENLITIERNHILPMASVTLEMPITNNVIWYTSSDGNVIEPNATDVFGANITSNTYENGVGVITFDGDVTTIGDKAFYGCTALTSVTIPDNVTTIGYEAFCNCDALKSVTIPDSVTTIGDRAFVSCDALKAFYGKFASEDNRCLIVNGVLKSFAIGCGLTEYTIPDSVTTIGKSAFADCFSLTSVTIPNSVTTIGNEAFHLCNSLTNATIPDSVTTIESWAFGRCNSLTSVTIPNSVTTIEDWAFSSCNALKTFYGKFASADNRCLIVNGVLTSFAPAELTEYTIPDSVAEIGRGAFAYCKLTNTTIPEDVTTIGMEAFRECYSLTSVTIPDSVTTIGGYAFSGCYSLKEAYCKPTTPPNLGAYSVFGDNASDRKIYVPTASVDAYKTADGWSEYADAICAMPIPSNQIWYTSSDGNVIEPYSGDYNSNATAMQLFGANITSNTYENGVGVITFDGDVTTIGDYAFTFCSSLTSVTIPDSVTMIGDDAFWDCSALTSVTIPDGVTTIGEDAFYSCDSLTAFYGKFASADNRCLIVDGVLNAFAIECGLTEYTIPDSVTTIGNWAFSNCPSLTSVTIGNSVTTIGNHAFYYCSSLTSVTIGDSVTTIGEDAFGICSKLTAFYGKFASADNRCLIVDGVLNAFAPAGLTEYTIPDSVTTIGSYAFRDYSSLTSVTIPDSVMTIGDDAFGRCTSLTSVTIPDSVTTIGNYAFQVCSSLTSVTIPDSVTTIGSYAFKDCSALKEVYCKPTTPPSLGNDVFDGNASDRKIYVPAVSVDAYKTADGWKEYADAIVAEYHIGDLVERDEAKGVVFYVDDSVVKIVSVTEAKNNKWCSRMENSAARNENNGMKNMNAAKTLDANLSYYPAFKWCADYGTDWYLPAKNELQAIYDNRSVINSTLSANGYTTLGTGYYWSSTGYDSYYAYKLNFSNGNWNSTNKYESNYARAVLAF